MNKVRAFSSFNEQLSDGQAVLLGHLGEEKVASQILNNFKENLSSSNLSFVTLDDSVNSNETFQQILFAHGSSLLSSGSELDDLSSKITSKYIDRALLIERIRAAGAGIPAFFVKSEGDAQGKQTKEIDGTLCVLEDALKGHVAIIKALKVDKEGNTQLVIENRDELYLAMSATYALVVADQIVEIGEIDPEYIHIPGLLISGICELNSLKTSDSDSKKESV